MTLRTSFTLLLGTILIAGCNVSAEDTSPDTELVAQYEDARIIEEGTTVTVYVMRGDDEDPYFSAETLDLGGLFVMGDPDAPHLVVEVADLQCPWCARSHDAIRTEKADLIESGAIKWAFLDFPLPSHGRAPEAHSWARCLGMEHPSAFFAAVDRLYETQESWSSGGPPQWAEILDGLGVSEDTERCVRDARPWPAIEANRDRGIERGVTGTPGYFIANLPVSGMLQSGRISGILDVVEQQGLQGTLESTGIPLRENQ